MLATNSNTNLDSTRLSPARRWLLQRMNRIYHGTMLGLLIRDGDPVPESRPKIQQSFKLGQPVAAKYAPREFTLKGQHVDLLRLFDHKRNGLISKLVIQDGLPYIVEWEDPYRD